MAALCPRYERRLITDGLRQLWPHRNRAVPDAENRRQVRRLIRWTIADLRAHRRTWGTLP